MSSVSSVVSSERSNGVRSFEPGDHRQSPSLSNLWGFFLAIFLLSAPLWVLGSAYQVELMPGLPISALMLLTCPIVAFAFTWRNCGVREAGRLLLRVFDLGRFPSPIWYVLTLMLMPCVLAASYLVMQLVGMPLPEPQIAWQEAPILFGLFMIAAAAEELAWSGTILEPLQARWGLLRSALILGIATAIWHVIPFAQAGNSATWIAGQCFFTVFFRIVIVAGYNLCGRSVLASIVIHASYNLAWQLFPNRGSGYDPWVATGLTLVVAIVLVSYARQHQK